MKSFWSLSAATDGTPSGRRIELAFVKLTYKLMTSRFWSRIRALLVWRLPPERLSLYFGLASCVFALLALLYAGRIFELQRRDALLFELERRYQEYERLLVSAECLNGTDNDKATTIDDVRSLGDVSAHLRALLLRWTAACETPSTAAA